MRTRGNSPRGRRYARVGCLAKPPALSIRFQLRPPFASRRGSDSLSVQGVSSCRHQPGLEQVEVGATVHLAFDELQTGDLAFNLTA